MAYQKKYALVAVAGIVVASGLAWWMQHKPAEPGASVSASAASGGAAGGQRVPVAQFAHHPVIGLPGGDDDDQGGEQWREEGAQDPQHADNQQGDDGGAGEL